MAPPPAKTTDPRFAKLHTDPRFVRPKAAQNKLVVDERFKDLFTEPSDGNGKGKGKGKGARSNKVDKYGRTLEEGETENQLKRYYRMEGDSTGKESAAAPVDDDEEEEEEGAQPTSFIDHARGEGLVESSDEDGPSALDGSSDSESDSDSGGSVTLGPSTLTRRRRPPPSRSPSIDLSETEPALHDDDAGADDSDDEADVDPTTRLALVNLDWDHLRAVDLYRVLSSCLSSSPNFAPPPPPPATSTSKKNKKYDPVTGEEIGPYKPPSKLVIAQGRLLNLRIYPSEFGRERMEREEREGPPREVFGEREEGSGSESGDEVTERDVIREQLEEGGEEYDGEMLRGYQLERLRYYYAIATFDTPQAAKHVLQEINGTEFERTANVFDLQYVPEATSFDDDPVHDEATESTIAAAGPDYQGVDFVTDALRHSKVKLTWDADDPHRKTKITNFLLSATDAKGKGKGKNAKALDEEEIKAYLASSSEGEDELDKEEEVDDFFEPQVGEKKKTKTKSREEFRSLFGLDKSTGGSAKLNEWDGGKSNKTDSGSMQITFAPALTDGDLRSRALADNDREETSIQTYERKEKERRERKRAERKAKREGIVLPPEGEEGPEFGGEGDGPGGFDDPFFGGVEEDGDAFAAFDAGEDLGSGDEIGERLDRSKKGKKEMGGEKKKLSKKEKREQKEQEEREREVGRKELELLVASDSEAEEGGKHFDMRAILKEEKKGKKGKGKAKGKGKKEGEGKEGKDEFKIDVTDERFKSVLVDYEFAIDPTNTKFQKSRNMEALLAEGIKRRAKNQTVRAPVSASYVAAKTKEGGEGAGDGEDLKRLVESVKRKAGDLGGRGKRRKEE